MNPLVLTTEEAAEQVGVSPVTVRRWVMKGWLHPLRRGAKPLHFDLIAVARCHADHQSEAERQRNDTRWRQVVDSERVERER